MAVPNPTTAPRNRPEMTWRDAATPLSQASRRRWTACYVLLLILLAAAVVDDAFAVNVDEHAKVPLIMFVAVPVVFGMLRRGTRRITALDHPVLDERDIDARNSAYRIAFPLLVLVVLAGLGLLAAFGLDETTRTTHVSEHAKLIETTSVINPNALIGLGLWVVLWATFLPTGTLAWHEPDAIELEAAATDGGFSEAMRDAVLGVALAAGLAISLAAETNAAALLFVAALTLVGALGRRAAGQPAMSRRRRWRVAIVLALLVVFIAIAIASSAVGG